jgi:hypothetical protein
MGKGLLFVLIGCTLLLFLYRFSTIDKLKEIKIRYKGQKDPEERDIQDRKKLAKKNSELRIRSALNRNASSSILSSS